MKCSKRRKDGSPCGGQAIAGTDACSKHAGVPAEQHKARGAVVVELRSWGLNLEEVRDPGRTLLQLMTQSAMRAELYAGLLQQAYEAAETLRSHHEAGALLTVDEDSLGGDGEDDDFAEPPSIQAARDTLDRIFTTGGVGALIGATYASTQSGHVYATNEAIRGLVQLEAAERDRCANMAAKAVAAGLAERQVRLAEQQGALVAGVIRAVLGDVGVDVASPEVQRVVATRLRELAGVA